MYSAPKTCSASPRSKARAQRRGAVRLEQRVQALDVRDPGARPPVRQLGEIVERGARRARAAAGASGSACRACPETAATICARCSGSVETASGSQSRGCVGLEAPGDDADAHRDRDTACPASPIASGGIEYALRLVQHIRPSGRRTTGMRSASSSGVDLAADAAAARSSARRAAGMTPVAREGRCVFTSTSHSRELRCEILLVEEAALLEERAL